ncbi:MAG: hypothetical protein K2X44_08440, partial [Magnetospirillum sp.]|nr:hypothetical protein [Magnetospirillum sp.]
MKPALSLPDHREQHAEMLFETTCGRITCVSHPNNTPKPAKPALEQHPMSAPLANFGICRYLNRL